MNFQELQVSLFQFPRAYSNVLVPFREIIRLIQYDADVMHKTQNFREVMRNMGKKTANETIKEKMVPAFSVAVRFKHLGHSKADAQGWTGLALCDIDHIDTSEAIEEAFQRLAGDPHVLLMYRTISGQGLRIIYSYEREDGQKIDDTSWRAAFFIGNEYLARLSGHGFDEACQDLTRLSGIAHDPALYVNADAVPFTIPDDDIAEQNCEYQEHGSARKLYEANTFHPEPDEAWARIEQMLSDKKLVYAPGHHHDYVLHAAYLFNRFGADLDALLEWASREWGDYDGKEREAVIRHKYKDTAKHGTWRLSAKKKGRENAMVTLPEIRQWLTEHIQVCSNIVTNQFVWRHKTLPSSSRQASDLEEVIPLSSPDWQQVDAILYNTLRGKIADDTGKRVLTSDVKSVIESDFARQVHPIREYIGRLPPWDGQDRVAELAGHIRAKGASHRQTDKEAQEALLWALHKWLVAMVATWMNDQESNHEIFTIIGDQGIYKTTFFRHLLPPPLHSYFWENAHNSFHNKDDKIALSENCIVEIEEVDTIEGRDMAELKGLVTSENIKERRPYAEFRELKPRLASFCASGNEQKILSDTTGNRRWLCFMVRQIDDPRRWNLDYEQLYAQLFDEYQNGFQYWFDKDEEARVELLNKPFCIVSMEEQLITTRLRKPIGNESCKLMNATMIAMYLLGGHFNSNISIHKIGHIMHKLKFSTKHTRDGDFYRVVEIPFNQQQTYIELAQSDEEDAERIGENADSKTFQSIDSEELELPF